VTPTNEKIDLITLRVIVAAADCGSISAASDRLNLAVAAASARITAMEESLKFKIFERSSRGVQLNAAGRMVVQRSRELLADADRLSTDLRDYSLGVKGHVRVLANASAMLEALPVQLEKFMRKHPLIRIDLEEQSSPDIAQAVLDGRADLGIADLAHLPLGLVAQDFFADTLVLVVPSHHALAQHDALALNEALDAEFITLTSGTALSNRLLAAALEAGKLPHIRMRMRSFDAVCRMVAAGLGVGVLPLEAIAPQQSCLPIKSVRLTDGWATRTHKLLSRQEPAPSPATQTLINALLS
jgi:DNA-binding transcriptional LysR family regulator